MISLLLKLHASSNAYQSVIGYNTVEVTNQEEIIINIEEDTTDSDIYLIFHNPSYFYTDSNKGFVLRKKTYNTQFR